MLAFRSEAHVDNWCRAWRFERGALLSLEQCWSLARAWYSADRREESWRRRSPDETKALFDELGLTSPFWNLTP